jgi:hypothetical protein
MNAHKFWIVEYVDVNAPKAERSVLCNTLSEARHRAVKRESLVHFSSLEDFVGEGFCDSLLNTHTFDIELGA